MMRLFRKARDFFAELKRRNVYQVALTYLAIAWVVCQAAWLLVPALLLPDWFFRAVVVTAALGFPIALVLAWAFERTPEGVRRTPEAAEEARRGGRHRDDRGRRAGDGRPPRRDEQGPRPRQREGGRRPPQGGRRGEAQARRPDSPSGRPQTVKLDSPPPGTCEMLPAELEVVAGDPDAEVVRFFDPGTDGDPAFTFGRRDDSSVTHVQLDSPTVSRHHARIAFGADGPRIENYSTTNPTQVNGEPLAGEGASTRLEDGDLIDMGEIRFRFHRN